MMMKIVSRHAMLMQESRVPRIYARPSAPGAPLQSARTARVCAGFNIGNGAWLAKAQPLIGPLRLENGKQTPSHALVRPRSNVRFLVSGN